MNRTRLLLLLTLALAAVIALYFGGCDKLITETIQTTIAGNPTADFTADIEIGCTPLTVQFTDASSGPHQKWAWDFGDGTTDSVADPVHTFDSPGLYDVQLTIIDTEYTGDNPALQGRDTELKKRFIMAGPTGGDIIATVNGVSVRDTATALCVGTAVDFRPTDTTKVDSVRWNFGDGTAQTTLFAPTHIYNSVGTFNVSLTSFIDTCGQYKKTDSSLIVITNCPNIDIYADNTVGCVPDTVHFTDSTKYPYTDTNGQPVLTNERLWDFGGGVSTSNSIEKPTAIFNEPGQYTIKLTIKDSEGAVKTDSFVNYITVDDSVSADFVALSPAHECYSPSGQFLVKFAPTYPGTFDSLLWEFGDTNSLGNPYTLLDTNTTTGPIHPVHAYINPGKYNVTLQIWGPCGSDSVTVPDFVTLSSPIQPDSIGFTIVPDTGDTNIAFQFSDTTNGLVLSREWNFGDGTATETGSSVYHTFSAYNTYWVKLTLTNDCGSWVDSAQVVVVGAK